MKRMMTAGTILFLLIATVLLTGCAGAMIPHDYKVALSNLPYPKDAPYGKNPDIVVVREGTNLRIVNRTPWAYPDMQLWVNQLFVYNNPSVNIGTNNIVPLPECINLYEESYPVGTFLRPERGYPVVLAELYDPKAKMKYRLNVQPVRDDPGIFW
ncbi:hypothetical protein [Poriferisphaera sp. WC338]|uniref:hypothetical protein n=1 Tax=Poriferisphaera sp. WC338 TaxID=3425129 RepID=UPI003D81701A